MTPKERLHFIRQLHHWSEALIEVGRYPFRRAEIFPPILTETGLISPPLVLWVNRQSLQAGGIIFLAGAEVDTAELGRCARAIGISHFILWTPQQLALWEQPDASQPARVRWQGSTSQQLQVQDFQLQLTGIFDQLRDRLVPGGIADANLSADFYATLCYHSLLTIRQPLLETLRIARGANKLPANLRPGHAAFAWGVTLLLQTLARRSDEQTQTQDKLAKKLSAVLTEACPEALVPDAVTTILSQFEHRLRQLRWGTDQHLAANTLALLEKQLAPPLGCVSELPRRLPLGGKRLFVNMVVPTPSDLGYTATPLFAIKMLKQLLLAEAPGHVFKLLESLRPESFDCIAANLAPAPFAPFSFTEDEGKALLRRVWPNRRVALPAKTPSWAYLTLAFLAAIKPEGELILELPKAWLSTPVSNELFEIIARHYQLDELNLKQHRTHQIRLKRASASKPAIINTSEGQRQTHISTSSQLRLVIDAPTPLWSLLENGQLSPLTEDDPRHALKNELVHYRTSGCGRFLNHYLGEPETLPTPPFELLSLFTGVSTNSERLTAERKLYLRLGIGEIVWDEQQATSSETVTSRRSPRLPRAKILEELQLAVRAEGLPLFPEHYLYDYFKPELSRYTFKGPLKPQGEFFGRFQLGDEQGNTLETENAATATALQLCSHLELETVLLPTDPEIIITIVTRYLSELASLSSKLHELAHRHINDQRQANRLVNEVWSQLPLPPFKLLDKIDSIA